MDGKGNEWENQDYLICFAELVALLWDITTQGLKLWALT